MTVRSEERAHFVVVARWHKDRPAIVHHLDEPSADILAAAVVGDTSRDALDDVHVVLRRGSCPPPLRAQLDHCIDLVATSPRTAGSAPLQRRQAREISRRRRFAYGASMRLVPAVLHQAPGRGQLSPREPTDLAFLAARPGWRMGPGASARARVRAAPSRSLHGSVQEAPQRVGTSPFHNRRAAAPGARPHDAGHEVEERRLAPPLSRRANDPRRPSGQPGVTWRPPKSSTRRPGRARYLHTRRTPAARGRRLSARRGERRRSAPRDQQLFR